MDEGLGTEGLVVVDTEVEEPMGVIHDLPAKMYPEIRDLWVAGLRSGNYREGTHFLRTFEDDRYDAFGVLADVATQLTVASWDHLRGTDYYHIFGYTNSLPYPIREWAGFRGMHPSQDVPLIWEGVKHPLFRLIDRYRVDHDTIADLIEMQY